MSAAPLGAPPRPSGGGKPSLLPDARPEKAQQRSRARPSLSPSTPPYVELHAVSAFSFLDGVSLPEDLVARAAELELPALALLDRNGVHGLPRLHQAARRAGLRALAGSEVVLAGEPGTTPPGPFSPQIGRAHV